ncbi:MAG: TetR family transcriptional regulator [Armatimonadetes bacterium]|nr:TetR family transcriptional regulator [Armatimonadota bacterium]
MTRSKGTRGESSANGREHYQTGLAARQRILEAAMQVVSTQGLHETRMSDIAEIAGMSPANVLYHFRTKAEVLVEALRWSESQATRRRREEFETIEGAGDRLVRFIELFTPSGRADPEVAIWLELWLRAPHDLSMVEVELELDRAWEDDLADIIALGVRRGEFARVDPDDFALRFCAYLDGLSLRVVIGRPTFTRLHMIDAAVRAAARELGFRPGSYEGQGC